MSECIVIRVNWVSGQPGFTEMLSYLCVSYPTPSSLHRNYDLCIGWIYGVAAGYIKTLPTDHYQGTVAVTLLPLYVKESYR